MIRDHDEVYGRSLPFGERPALILIELTRAYFEPGAELYSAAPVVTMTTPLGHCAGTARKEKPSVATAPRCFTLGNVVPLKVTM